MTGWTSDELDRIGAADELEVTPMRSRRPVTIWVVRHGGALGLGILVTVFAAAGSSAQSAHELLAQRVSASFTGAAVMLALALLITVIARPRAAAAKAICERAAVA